MYLQADGYLEKMEGSPFEWVQYLCFAVTYVMATFRWPKIFINILQFIPKKK